MAEEAVTTEAELTLEAGSGEEPLIYEVGYHLVPTIAEADVSSHSGEIRSLVEHCGGTFIAEEIPRRMGLSYTMAERVGKTRQKFDHAYFGWIKFQMLPENVLSLKKDLDPRDDILRYILILTTREIPSLSRGIGGEVGLEGRSTYRKVREEKKPISEEELDRTIQELIVE